jgi:hypothetical protein
VVLSRTLNTGAPRPAVCAAPLSALPTAVWLLFRPGTAKLSPALLMTTSVASGNTSCACSAGLATSDRPLLVVPPAADSTVCCHGANVRFCTCSCTAPARLAMPETLIRSEVAPATLMSASSRPVVLCTRLPVSAVVWITPVPPGDSVPALVSVLPAPRLTVVPALKNPPAMLLKALVPLPRVTLPMTVPKLLTVLLPVSPWIARPDSAVTVPRLVSVLLVPPEIKTPAPEPLPPNTVPELMVTVIGPPLL